MIGKNAVVSYGCTLITKSDTPSGKFMNDASPTRKRRLRVGSIRIEDGAFVGAHSVIMPGVTIGRRTVVGALSYVDSSLPPNLVYIPKKSVLIRRR